jgi:hypothetical protein
MKWYAWGRALLEYADPSSYECKTSDHMRLELA